MYFSAPHAHKAARPPFHTLDDAGFMAEPPLSVPRTRRPGGRRSQHDAAALHALQEARVHARLARQRHAAGARHLQDACKRGAPRYSDHVKLNVFMHLIRLGASADGLQADLRP